MLLTTCERERDAYNMWMGNMWRWCQWEDIFLCGNDPRSQWYVLKIIGRNRCWRKVSQKQKQAAVNKFCNRQIDNIWMWTQDKHENQNMQEDQLIVFINWFFWPDNPINLSVKSQNVSFKKATGKLISYSRRPPLLASRCETELPSPRRDDHSKNGEEGFSLDPIVGIVVIFPLPS